MLLLYLFLFSCSVMSDSLQPHGLQHGRLPCPSPSPTVCSNSCPLSRWCHPTVSSSVSPFSSCLLSFPASGSFVMSWLFASGGQTVGVSHYILRSHLVFSVFENGLKLVPSLPQRAKWLILGLQTRIGPSLSSSQHLAWLQWCMYSYSALFAASCVWT